MICIYSFFIIQVAEKMPEIIYNSYIPSELYCLTALKHLQNVILRDTRRLLHPDNITLDSLCLNVEP